MKKKAQHLISTPIVLNILNALMIWTGRRWDNEFDLAKYT